MEYIEFTLEITPIEVGRDILIAELAEVGFESFLEYEKGVKAYVQKETFEEELMNSIPILSNIAFDIKYTKKKIEDQNWNEEWEKNFELINVENQCVIRAPFHEKVASVKYDIVIDPKMSFGTGHHETTYLMIKRLLALELSTKKVLDMGCGTGVLAILAKMKKASIIEAIDIDEWAFNNTRENIMNNSCEDIVVKKGGAEKIDSIFDVVIANINRNILLTDMDKYVAAMEKGGDLLLSGFFSSDTEMLLESTSNFGLEFVYSESKNDWTLLHLIKK